MTDDDQHQLPPALFLLFAEALLALTTGDFAKAWPTTKLALEQAHKWKGTLDGQALAVEIERPLDVPDSRLCTAFGEKWSQVIGVPHEILPDKSEFRCSFCKKTGDEVAKLFAGPRFFVCDECLDLCKEIIQAR